MDLIALHVRQRSVRFALKERLRPFVHVIACRHDQQFESALRRLSPLAAVIDASDRRGMSSEPLIQRLRLEFPHLPIVVVVRLATGDREAIVPAVRAGADEVLLLGFDDHSDHAHAWRMIRLAVARRSHGGDAQTVLDVLAHHLPADVLPVFEYVTKHGTESLSVDSLARHFGINRRRLARLAHRLDMPPPGEIITWARLLLAASLLEQPSLTVEVVARRCRFASAIALRRAMRAFVGVPPSEIGALGGLKYVLHEFGGALQAIRSRTAS